MIDIATILKDLYYCDFNIQKWINHRFRDPSKIVIDKASLAYVTTTEGLKFHCIWGNILHQVLEEYQFQDIEPNDVVLDLGANIGAFALRAALKCRHVYAVEPLYPKELTENIALNNLQDKITVLPYGIGDGRKIPIKFFERVETIQTYPFMEILKMTGPVSFLKCDIEGAEWVLRPEEIANIRRLEFEVHLGKGHSGEDLNLLENEDLIRFIYDHWNTTTDLKEKPSCGYHLHAYPLDSKIVHNKYQRPHVYTGIQ
jgi:hypothetical protein